MQIELKGPPMIGTCSQCGANLAWLKQRGIEGHVHGLDKERDMIGAAIDAFIPKEDGWGKTKQQYDGERFELHWWLEKAASPSEAADLRAALATALRIAENANESAGGYDNDRARFIAELRVKFLGGGG